MASTKFYYVSHIDLPFVSKMTPDVTRAHLNFISYIEDTFKTKVELIDTHKYFGRAFEIWFKMITGGKSDQVGIKIFRPKIKISKFLKSLIILKVSTLLSSVEIKYDENNNLIASINRRKNPLIELFKSLFGMSEHTLPALALGLLEKLPMSEEGETREQFEAELNKIRGEFEQLLGTDSVLIFPAYPSIAPYHNQALFTNPLDWAVYFGYINSIGLPSTHFPLGLSKKDRGGMPVGVQLISGRFCDKLTIQLAQLFEKDLGGWVEP